MSCKEDVGSYQNHDGDGHADHDAAVAVVMLDVIPVQVLHAAELIDHLVGVFPFTVAVQPPYDECHHGGCYDDSNNHSHWLLSIVNLQFQTQLEKDGALAPDACCP